MSTPAVASTPSTPLDEAPLDGANDLKSSRHIPALDALRGVAILLVMFHHFTPGVATPSFGGWFFNLVHCGWCGVDLFFVLSGFLISGILLDARDKPRYFRNFYMRRVLRILPLYYGVLAAVFLLIPLVFRGAAAKAPVVYQDQAWMWMFCGNFRMVWQRQWSFNQGWLLLAHFWSLAVEEHFYLVWPAIVWLAPRRKLCVVCIGLMVLAPALRVLCVWTDPVGTVGQNHLAGYMLTPCRMDDLAFGGLIAILVRRPGGVKPLLGPAAAAGILALAVLGVIFVRREGLLIVDPLVQTLGYSMTMLLCGSVLVLFLLARPGSVMGGICQFSVLRLFGKYSYGLYVFHLLLLPWFDRMMPVRAALPMMGAYLVMAMGISLGIAMASWHLYESQFLKLKRFFQ